MKDVEKINIEKINDKEQERLLQKKIIKMLEKCAECVESYWSEDIGINEDICLYKVVTMLEDSKKILERIWKINF